MPSPFSTCSLCDAGIDAGRRAGALAKHTKYHVERGHGEPIYEHPHMRKEDSDDEDTGEVTMSMFMSEKLKPAEWLVDGLVPAETLGGLLGQYKAGKSLSGLQLCFSVATGVMFVGRDVTKRGPAVFIEYEGSRARLQERMKGMAAKYGVLDGAAPLSVIHRPAYKLDTDAGQAWLRRVCEGKVLCVIGPVSKAASIENENDQHAWSRLAERLQAIVDETGCSVVLVHHTRKPSQQFGPPKKVDDYFNTARGSNAYMGAVDFALGVQRDPNATDGILFYLERDGESGMSSYEFDTQSLCIFPSDKPVKAPSAADNVEALWTYIEQHPGLTRAALAAAFGKSADTIKDWLQVLGDRAVTHGTGNETRTYTVAEEAPEAP